MRYGIDDGRRKHEAAGFAELAANPGVL